MQYQDNLFLDTKSSAENKYIKFVKHDAFPVPNGKDGASARKRTKVNPPKEKRNSSATVQQKQIEREIEKTSRLDITPNYLAKGKERLLDGKEIINTFWRKWQEEA